MRTIAFLTLVALCSALHAQLPSRAGSVDEIEKLPADTSSLNLNNVSNEMLAALSRFTALKRLSFNSRNGTYDDTGVAHIGKLTQLLYLDLSENPYSAEAAMKLAALTKLRTLNLSENPAITEAVVNKLKEALKETKISYTKPRR